MFEIGACVFTQTHIFYSETISSKTCVIIEKIEAQTSEAFVHVDSENVIILLLTTSGKS